MQQLSVFSLTEHLYHRQQIVGARLHIFTYMKHILYRRLT
jgi:hypothetical protein